MTRPTVHREFVFNGPSCQWQGDFPDRVVVRIAHRIATTAPAVESAVDVDRGVGRPGITAHIHPEGDIRGLSHGSSDPKQRKGHQKVDFFHKNEVLSVKNTLAK